MFRLINKLKNRRGFTLIELIVVLAVLAIVMAIAVPRFMGVQDQSRLKADASSAQQIINSARLQETNNNDDKVIRNGATTAEHEWDVTLMAYPSPQSSTNAFVLTGGGKDKYEVKWTPTKGSIKIEQKVTEGTPYSIKLKDEAEEKK